MTKILLIKEGETETCSSYTEAGVALNVTERDIRLAIKDGTGIRDKQGNLVWLDELLEN